MNILNITTVPELRGGDIQMYTIYTLLKEYKDLNQFILCPDNSDLAQKYKGIDSEIITYKKKSKIFDVIPSIIKVVKEKNINIINIHDSSALTATLLASFFFSAEVKIILSRKRDNKIKKNILGKLKYGNKRISKIVSVSKAVESIFYDVVKDRSKLITIYDAIDVHFFSNTNKSDKIHKEFGFDSNTKIIGNIAALTNQKDIYTFVNTAKKIIDKSVFPFKIKFIVIGKGDKKQELLDYIQSLELQNDIYLLGFRNNIKELLSEFDVFLLTSISEGLPLAIYEAFASKIPVVTTKAGGIPEVVKEGETGFIANIKDSEKLSNDVIQILENDRISKTITQNAFELVKTQFDLPILRANYYKLYKSMIS